MLGMTIIGNIGNDPEVRRTDGGQNVLNLSVAHTEKWTNAEGEPVEKTTWTNCTIWGDLAVALGWLKKGLKIYATGIPSVRTYMSGGDIRTQLCLKVNYLECLTPKGQSETDEKKATDKVPA